MNVNVTKSLLLSLEERAAEMKMSREAVINMLLRQALTLQPKAKQPQAQTQTQQRKSA